MVETTDSVPKFECLHSFEWTYDHFEAIKAIGLDAFLNKLVLWLVFAPSSQVVSWFVPALPSLWKWSGYTNENENSTVSIDEQIAFFAETH